MANTGISDWDTPVKPQRKNAAAAAAVNSEKRKKAWMREMGPLMEEDLLRKLVTDGDLNPEALESLKLPELYESAYDDDNAHSSSYFSTRPRKGVANGPVSMLSMDPFTLQAVERGFEQVRNIYKQRNQVHIPTPREAEVKRDGLLYETQKPATTTEDTDGGKPKQQKKKKTLMRGYEDDNDDDDDDEDDEGDLSDDEEDDQGHMAWETRHVPLQRRVNQEHAHYIPPMPRALMEDMVNGQVFSTVCYPDVLDWRTHLGALGMAPVCEMMQLSKYKLLEELVRQTDTEQWFAPHRLAAQLKERDVAIAISNAYLIPSQEAICLVVRLDPRFVFYAVLMMRVRISGGAAAASLGERAMIKDRYVVWPHNEYTRGQCWLIRDRDSDDYGISIPLNKEQREAMQREAVQILEWQDQRNGVKQRTKQEEEEDDDEEEEDQQEENKMEEEGEEEDDDDDVYSYAMRMKQQRRATSGGGTPTQRFLQRMVRSPSRIQQWWHRAFSGDGTDTNTQVRLHSCVFFYCGCAHVKQVTTSTAVAASETNHQPVRV